jgi:glycine dehydrogenase
VNIDPEPGTLNSEHRGAVEFVEKGAEVYARLAAAFPTKSLHDYKFWPHLGRVDNVFGDRNPVCSCVGMEDYS